MDIIGFNVPIWLLLSMVCFVLYTLIMSRHHRTFKRLGIPGPSPLPIVGNIPEFIKRGKRHFDMHYLKKYGKVFGYYASLFPTNIVVADRDILRKLLVKHVAEFSERAVIKGVNGDLEEALVHLSGNRWKHVRNKISPAFSTAKLRKMLPLVDHASDTLVQTLKERLQTAECEIEMCGIFEGFAMDAVCSTAFGIQVDSQRDPDNEFVSHVRRFLNISFSSPMILSMIFLPFTRIIMSMMGICLVPKDVQAFFRKVTSRLLEERTAGSEEYSDFLQLMKNSQIETSASEDEFTHTADNAAPAARKSGITFSEILANAEVFFFAGYETTTIALSMCIYNLAIHTDYQKKIRKELQEKIDKTNLTYDSLSDIHYLDMCLNESLRIFPPATRMDRICVKETEINGVRFLPGMNVIIPIYAIHHDPDIWEDPEKFYPERFLSEGETKRDPLTFLPFGYGPRNCIGMKLALLELKVALAKIILNFKFSVCSKTQIPPEMIDRQLMRPKSCWIRLEEI